MNEPLVLGHFIWCASTVLPAEPPVRVVRLPSQTIKRMRLPAIEREGAQAVVSEPGCSSTQPVRCPMRDKVLAASGQSRWRRKKSVA